MVSPQQKHWLPTHKAACEPTSSNPQRCRVTQLLNLMRVALMKSTENSAFFHASQTSDTNTRFQRTAF